MLHYDVGLLLQIWLDRFYGLSSCLDFVLTVRTMDGAFGADRTVTVKTEIRQLFFRVGIAHVGWAACFLGRYVVGVVGGVAGLRNRGVRLGNWRCVGGRLILLVGLRINLLGSISWFLIGIVMGGVLRGGNLGLLRVDMRARAAPEPAGILTILIFLLALCNATKVPLDHDKLSVVRWHWRSPIQYTRRIWHKYRPEWGHKNLGRIRLGGAVVDWGAVDAGVMHAGEHQHLFVVLLAHHARRDFLVWHCYCFFYFEFLYIYVCNVKLS